MATPCTNDPNEVIEKVVSAKANADKFNAFVNGTDTETVQLGTGDPTPTIRNAVRQIMADASWAKQYIADAPDGDVSLNNAAAMGTFTSRTLAERFSDIVNVKDFGAVGDGVTDDTAAIRQALVAGQHKTVWFPSGIYIVTCDIEKSLCTTAFEIANPVNVVGSNATISCAFTGVASGFEDFGVIFLVRSSDVHFYGLKFIDASSFAALYSAVAAGGRYDDDTDWMSTRYTDITIDYCEMDGFGYGFSFKFNPSTYTSAGGISRVRISNCLAIKRQEYSNRNGAPYHFACPNLSTEPISDVLVTNCIGIGYRNAATFGLYGVARGVISNCRSERNTQVGFQCENGAIGCILSNNISIDDNTGIILDDTGDTVVDGLHFVSLTEQLIADDPTHFFNGRIRPAVYVSFQGSSTLAENQNLDLAGIEISNVTAIDGFITLERFSTLPDNPNRLTHVSISNASIKCTDKTFSGRKDGIFVASANIDCLISNVRIENFYRSGILLSAVNTTSIVNPILRGNGETIIYSGAKPVVVVGGILDSVPSGSMVSVVGASTGHFNESNVLDYYRQEADIRRGRLVGYTPVADIMSVPARQGSMVSLDTTTYGVAYIKHDSGATENAGYTSDGWRLVATDPMGSTFWPDKDNALDLGTANRRWANVYAGTGTIQTSDARFKTQIAAPSEALLRAWGRVGLKVFQFRDAVERKGEEARLHMGVVAQEVQAAFEAEGLDASQYGLFCHDEWGDEFKDVEVVDSESVYGEDGELLEPERRHSEHRQVQFAGDKFSIRYDEALVLEAAYHRWLGEKRDARIAELEARLNELSDKDSAPSGAE